MTPLPGPSGYGFHFTQAGRFVGFELEPTFASGPAEPLGEHRYLSVAGNAPAASAATLTDDVFTIPFWGTFECCRLTSPMTGALACNQVPAAQRLEYHVCSSPRSLLVFTRR